MKSRMSSQNTLADQVETEGWNRRPTTLQRISSMDVSDFPKLDEEGLLMVRDGSLSRSRRNSRKFTAFHGESTVGKVLGP